MSSAKTQERKPGDIVEGVAKVNFHNNPTRVTLERQPHGGREDLDATRHAHAKLRRPKPLAKLTAVAAGKEPRCEPPPSQSPPPPAAGAHHHQV